MRQILFFVPGPPVAQQRAKTRFKDGNVLGKYDPEKCKNYKALVKQMAWQAMTKEQFSCTDLPVRMEMTFFLPRAKSISKKKRPHPITRPDIDNLYKGVADGMEGIVYDRDEQVIVCTISKRYADGDPVGCEIRVMIDDGEPWRP